MTRLLAAIRFLTIFPVPGAYGTTPADLARSVPCFPLVGLLLGAIAGGAAYGLVHLALPPWVLAAALVILLLSFSKALHMDGLSDTADGFLSSRQRERILEIMKDSHIGSMGVLAIVSVLMLKLTALASMPAGDLWRGVALMPLAGRCVMVLEMAILPYARPEGLATVFYQSRPKLAAVWALVVLAMVGGLIGGTRGLAAAGVAVLVTLLFCQECHRKIGGATGDTFGAACELAETTVALSLAIWPVAAV